MAFTRRSLHIIYSLYCVIHASPHSGKLIGALGIKMILVLDFSFTTPGTLLHAFGLWMPGYAAGRKCEGVFVPKCVMYQLCSVIVIAFQGCLMSILENNVYLEVDPSTTYETYDDSIFLIGILYLRLRLVLHVICSCIGNSGIELRNCSLAIWVTVTPIARKVSHIYTYIDILPSRVNPTQRVPYYINQESVHRSVF